MFDARSLQLALVALGALTVPAGLAQTTDPTTNPNPGTKPQPTSVPNRAGGVSVSTTPSAPKQPTAGQVPGAQQLAAASGMLYIPDGMPGLDGMGFTFDAQLGGWTLRKPAMVITLDSNYVLQSTNILLETSSTLLAKLHSSDLGVDVSAAYGLVKAAATYAQTTSTGQTQSDTQFSLVSERRYEPKIFDLSSTQPIAWTPEALAIMAIADPYQRALAWKAAFGEYVAIGYDVHARLALKVSLTDMESYSSKQMFAGLKVKYAGISGSASAGVSFAELVKTVKSESGLSISIDYVGDKPLTVKLPVSVSEIDEDHEMSEFVNDIESNLLGSHVRRGLILVPWSAVPGAPQLDFASFSGPAVGFAAAVAQQAVAVLEEAAAWSYPASVPAFLDAQFSSTGGPSIGDQLNQARMGVVNGLQNLWLKLAAYAIDPNGATSDELMAASAAVQAATGFGSAVGLSDVLVDIDSVIAALPTMAISVGEGHVPNPGASPSQYGAVGFWVTLRNVGYFSEPSLALPWLKLDGGATGTRTFSMYEDNSGSAIYLDPHTYSNGKLGNSVVVSVVPAKRSGADGLFDITFQVMTNVWVGTSTVHFQAYDDLGRSAYLLHTL
jgi:hypothetical protein